MMMCGLHAQCSLNGFDREPANCYIMGRHEERENGTLPVLKAFETITNTVRIEFTEE